MRQPTLRYKAAFGSGHQLWAKEASEHVGGWQALDKLFRRLVESNGFVVVLFVF